MFLGVVGISHKTAPVEVREKLSELRQVLSDAVAYERDPLRFITPVTVLVAAMCILYITIQQAPEKR